MKYKCYQLCPVIVNILKLKKKHMGTISSKLVLIPKLKTRLQCYQNLNVIMVGSPTCLGRQQQKTKALFQANLVDLPNLIRILINSQHNLAIRLRAQDIIIVFYIHPAESCHLSMTCFICWSVPTLLSPYSFSFFPTSCKKSP